MGAAGCMRRTGRAAGAGRAVSAEMTTKRPKPPLKKVLPEVWALMQPRKWLIAGSFVPDGGEPAVQLCAAGVVAAVYQPRDDGRRTWPMLPKIIGAVAAATFIQAITSYALTQLLSTEGQKLISELRMKVQAHIGRLPVAFYDENRTGTLVARIMTDVEGVRNLVGTGLVDFVGGVLTAVIAFVLMIHINARMTLLTFCDYGGVRADPAEGVQDDPADLPGAGEDQRRGDGPADRVAGRRAGGEGIPRGGERGEGVCGRA